MADQNPPNTPNNPSHKPNQDSTSSRETGSANTTDSGEASSPASGTSPDNANSSTSGTSSGNANSPTSNLARPPHVNTPAADSTTLPPVYRGAASLLAEDDTADSHETPTPPARPTQQPLYYPPSQLLHAP
ncbi:MAG: hypothetical protein M1814_001601 [Vezdaea aestivalis]|nr:MAG: hypothetical protein M1814_001601 [Vezdaea aestivalis]